MPKFFLKVSGIFALTAALIASAPARLIPAVYAAEAEAGKPSDIVISSMQKELDRSFNKLKNIASAPLYFLSYALYDIERIDLRATYGAINSDDQTHYRVLNVDLRVGDKHLDNSHQLRAGLEYHPPLALGMGHYRGGSFPLQDDADAIRNRLWMATDSAFRLPSKALCG